MNRPLPERIVSALLEVRFGPEDYADVAGAALLEPENFMDAKSSNQPIRNRNWLTKRYEVDDDNLGGFTINLFKTHWLGVYEVLWGFDTDMKYRTRMFELKTPEMKRTFNVRLRWIVESLIPGLVDRLNGGKVRDSEFSNVVGTQLSKVFMLMPEP